MWGELAKHKAITAGEQTSTIVRRLLQSLGIILHRENARAILRRFPSNMGRDCSDLLSASADCSANVGVDPDTPI